MVGLNWTLSGWDVVVLALLILGAFDLKAINRRLARLEDRNDVD